MPRPTHEESNRSKQAVTISDSGIVGSATRTFNCYSRDYNSVNTPSYFRLAQQKHGLPINNTDSYTITRDELLYGMVFRDDINNLTKNAIDTWRGYYPTANPNDHSWSVAHSQQAFERAKQSCINKIKGLDFNAAQAVAEAQKTADLIGDTAKRIAQTVIAFRKGKFKQGFKALGSPKGPPFVPRKSAADNWLAIQYGWIPLLSDVKNAAEKLAQTPKPPYFTFTGTSSAADSQAIHKYPNIGGGGLTYYELGYNSKARVSMTFAVRNHVQKTLSELGISDPALLVWELLPYSFVVDWFYPVGAYLQSVNYTDGLTYVGGYTVQLSETNWRWNTKAFTSAGGGKARIWPAAEVGTSHVCWFSRRYLPAPLHPSLPRIKNPLSLTHMANGLALLSKAFK